MSLKSFHLFFIGVSILFAVGFGLWILQDQPIASESLNVLAALCAFTAAGALVVYAVRFLRKFKHFRFM